MDKHVNFNPPAHWMKIRSIDMHTGGEPLRILIDGLPEIMGKTILEKRRYFRDHYDHIRTALIWEPRGHADMYGAILTDPEHEDSDFGVIFIHNEGYSTMCGHAVLALARMAIETGMVKKEPGEEIKIDVPAGTVRARYGQEAMEPSIYGISTFLNVPSFVLFLDGEVTVREWGDIKLDLAFGGAFYAFVDAGRLGFKLVPEENSRLKETAKKIREAVNEKYQVIHPFEEDLGFLYGVIFTGEAHDQGHHSRNVCIFAEGELDRSSTGTGVSARAAIHYARRELKTGEKITIESILGTIMQVSIRETVQYGPYPAVIPEVSGRAWYTGEHTFWIDPSDPLGKGFLLGKNVR